MQTPNTHRGRETERLMLLWRHENPTADTAAYNAQYARTYNSLTEFSDMEDRSYPDWEAQFDTTDPRTENRAKVPPPKYAFHPGRRAQTKGAFGKPKHLRRR